MALQYIYHCCFGVKPEIPIHQFVVTSRNNRGRGWLAVGAIYCHQIFLVVSMI